MKKFIVTLFLLFAFCAASIPVYAGDEASSPKTEKPEKKKGKKAKKGAEKKEKDDSGTK